MRREIVMSEARTAAFATYAAAHNTNQVTACAAAHAAVSGR